uniref:UPAR/Ly6 domain-containing protein n=1 Tax=Crocodylus porosus TaxID=8502 RepID=A0A7M4G012_CROPO
MEVLGPWSLVLSMRLCSLPTLEKKGSFSATNFSDMRPSNWNCMASKACAQHEKYCMTTFVSGGLGNEKSFHITKKCAADCSQTNVNLGVTAISTNCCATWLCNVSGASSVKTSFAVMAFGVLASFLCVLRVGL